MKLMIITNLRQFEIDSQDVKLQNRSGKGFNVFSLANKKVRKGEEIIEIQNV